MTAPVVVGAVLRVDLRGYSGDAPTTLGAPLRDEEMRDGMRTLHYDLGAQAGDGVMEESCARLALFLERHFIEPEEPPFAQAFARRMKLELGLMVEAGAANWSCDLPVHLLDCLSAMEAAVGLTFYPHAPEDDAVQEEI